MKVHFVPLLEQFRGRRLSRVRETRTYEIEEAVDATAQQHKQEKGWQPAGLDIFRDPQLWPWEEQYREKLVIFPMARQKRAWAGRCTNAARIHGQGPTNFSDESLMDEESQFLVADDVLVALVESGPGEPGYQFPIPITVGFRLGGQ